MLRNTEVARRESPGSTVIPAKAPLLANDSIVADMSSLDIGGTKHSIFGISVN